MHPAARLAQRHAGRRKAKMVHGKGTQKKVKKKSEGNLILKKSLHACLECVRCKLTREILSQIAAVAHPGDSGNIFSLL